MAYLVAEILAYLIGAFGLGALIAWLIRGYATARRLAAFEARWAKESEHWRRQLTEAEARLALQTDELNKVRQDFESTKTRMAQLEAEVTAGRGLEQALAEARGKVTDLRQTTEKLSERERQFRMAEREVSLLRVRVDDLNTVIHEQQAALDAKNEHVVKLSRHIEQLEPLSAELQLRNLTIAELQSRVRKLERERKRVGRSVEPSSERSEAPESEEEQPQRDNLKRIHGIGPVLERLLNRLGYERYEQIAGWTSEDIDRIDAQLGAFSGRIRRDDWVAQAKQLMDERTVRAKRLPTRGKPIALARRS